MALAVEKPYVKDKLVRYGRSFYYLLANRRKFDRHPVSGKIMATCKDKYGQLITHVCTCVDLSLRGIAIDAPELLPAEMDVHLDSDELDFRHFGRVRYCSQHGSEFRVGLEFTAEPEYWREHTW
jgi:hypothetical protein